MPRRARPFALAAFLLPALVFLAVCAAMGFAPFGESSILIFDLSDQFVEFLCALKHGEVFFSWNTALGGSYIGTFSYYVSSPFSLLTLLCPNEHMPIAVVFLVALKLGLAGLTFSLLLRRRTGRCDLTTVAVSLCYALMAYNMAYAMSFMWLDGVLWLPVLLMGVEDLLEGKRPWALLGGLVVSFVSTWYISYMTGIFCALYLLWRCGCEGISLKNTAKRLLRLAGWAGLALLLTAWLWLPTALSMLTGKLADAGASIPVGFHWPLTTLFYKLLVPGAYDSVTYTGSAFLYCSLLAVPLAAAWFFRPGTTVRARVCTLALGGFLAVSLWFVPLDAVWHLFQLPNSFPGRWSFVVSCFLLLLAYDALLWLLSLVKSIRLSKVLPPLLALLLTCDMGANALLLFRSLDAELHFESYHSYHFYKTRMQKLVDTIHSQDTFQRVANDDHRSRNEPAAFGYKGLTFFSSSYNAKVNELLNNLGYAQDWFWSTSQCGSPVADALMGIGWRMGGQGLPLPAAYEALEPDPLLHRGFEYAAPGYFTTSGPSDADLWSWPQDNPFLYQNQLMKLVAGWDLELFTPLSARRVDEYGRVQFHFISNGQPVYAYFDGQLDDPEWAIDRALCPEMTNGLQYLGTFPEGTEHELLVYCSEPVTEASQLKTPLLYTLNTEHLQQMLDALKENRLHITDHGNGWLEGTLNASRDGEIFTSIPAIPGWTVNVDGQRVECGAFRDTLLTIPVAQGTHTISMHYTPPGLYPGLGLTAVGLLVLILLGKKRI